MFTLLYSKLLLYSWFVIAIIIIIIFALPAKMFQASPNNQAQNSVEKTKIHDKIGVPPSPV